MKEAATLRWDASIDLTAANIDPHLPVPQDVIRSIQAAVEALTGASQISVELHIGAPRTLRWLTIYRAGTATPPEGPAWNDIRDRIEYAVRAVTGVF